MIKFTLRRGLAFFDQTGRRWTIDRQHASKRIHLINDTGEVCALFPDEIYKKWRCGHWNLDPDSVVNNHQDVIYTTMARDLGSFTDDEKLQAMQRLEFIKPLLDKHRLSNTAIGEYCKANSLPCSDRPPSARSVRRWIRCYKAAYDVTQLVDRKPCRRPVNDPRFVDLFELALETEYLTKQRIDRSAAINEVRKLIKQHNCEADVSDHIKLPSRATLYRRLQDLDTVSTDRARYGRFEAMRLHRTALSSAIARCILDRIEIDHTNLDIILIDTKTGKVLGRPWLTIAIDVYSKMIYGYWLTFDPPSSNSVLQCLLRGITPKEDLREKYPDLINPWPAHGFPVTAVFDNGLDAHAARVLDSLAEMSVAFVQYCPSRVPWFKGAVERFFRTLNCLIHTLPGTTFSNPKQRVGYQSEKEAAMDLGSLEHVLLKWIVDFYHLRTHRTTKMPPLERWNYRAQSKDIYLPSSIGELQLLLGAISTRRLFHYGIEFDKLRYNSPELQDINRRINKHTSTKKEACEITFKSYQSTVEYIDALDPDTKVEQMAHNHCVDGSNPSLATTYEVVTGKSERVGVQLPL